MDHKSNGKVLRTQVKTHENGLTEKNCTNYRYSDFEMSTRIKTSK